MDGSAFERCTIEPVEHTVGIIVVLRGIHAVQPEKLNQRNTLLGTTGKIAYSDTSFTALIQYVETEILPSYLSTAQEIDIFHHQLPQRALGIHTCSFY